MAIPPQALIAIEKALHLQPRTIAAHELRLQILKAIGERAKIEECFNTIFELAPDQANIILEKADFLQSIKRLKEAESAYREALALDPDNARALNNLGNTLSKQGHLHESISYFEKAIKHNPELSEAYILSLIHI